MHGAEGVGNIDVRHIGQRAGEGRVVLLLALVKAQVFQQHDLSRPQGGGLGARVLADDVVREDHRPPQQPAQPLGHRRKRQLRLPGSPGLAQV